MAKRYLITGLVLLSACGAESKSIDAKNSHNATEAAQLNSSSLDPSRLDKILTPKNIGINLSYMNFLIGVPARKMLIDDIGLKVDIYEKNDCTIVVGSKDDKVVSIGANIVEQKCDIDVGYLLNRNDIHLASQSVYGDYAIRGPLHFTDDQIPSCNACGEGSAPNALIDGYGAIGYFDVMLAGWGDDSRDKWMELLKSSGAYDYGTKLPLEKDNCPLRRVDTQAFGLLKHTKVTRIEFGIPGSVQPVCSGETATTMNLREN